MRAAEHCPVCIVQARGGGAIPRLALSTIDRFVIILWPFQPWNYPMATVERLASGGYSYQIEEWYNSARGS